MDVYVAFDIETTGTDVQNDHVTEIAAYKFARGDDGRWIEIGRFTTLVNPGIGIPQLVKEIIPITDEMVRNAPSEKTAVAAFKAFVGDAKFVGHNCNFDLKFISHIDPSFGGRPMLDTYWLSRVMLPGKPHYSLVELVLDQKLKAFHSNPHRAWSDARATAALFAGLVRAAESLPAADLDALRKTRGHGAPMWTRFLFEAVRGNGVGGPKPEPKPETGDPTAWWTEDVANVDAQAVPPSRRWRLGERLRRTWIDSLPKEMDFIAKPRATPGGLSL